MEKIQLITTSGNVDGALKRYSMTLGKWAERMKCPVDRLKVQVTVELPFKPRTTGYKSQNHALNGYIQQICMETGQDFATTKNYIKTMAIAMGYPIKKRRLPNGQMEDISDWFGNPVGISESDASMQDCSLLIDCAVQLASELGMTLYMGD